MKVKIKNKKFVAKDTLRVEFELEKNIFFRAGQHSSITIEDIEFEDPRGNMRLFSFVNPPFDNKHYIITTRLRGSGFKEALKNLPDGSTVDMGGVGGDLVLPDDKSQPLVFIAGGIGITPFMSMLSHIFENNLPYKITLFYSNRDRESTPYFDEIEKWASKHENFDVMFLMTKDDTWKRERGHIDGNVISEYIDDINGSQYFVVGPPKMVKSVEQELLNVGIDEEQILRESFGGY